MKKIQKYRDLTAEQIQSTFSYLNTGGQVLNPVKWKQKAITVNYVIASVPALCAMLKAFDIINFDITVEQAELLWQIAFGLVGLLANFVLAITSKNININPFNKTTTKDISDSDE